ncbi:MAG TPA: ATP synthase F1 subunit epsilon [Bacteroidales bacterium]|jgi:F-type H+-transporting ATPase subunit epsilon|nr:ATP synthase F1 subunit epsilon [Bacteroidales bacterium]OQC38123.1 MAG: ATP synthase epsilon chain [Bacteroidetes bacterium ADurb.Bin041]MBP7874053.1 ATP synthase F1 subunit epsilon [Bacteroidales bacterium]MCZ2281769.1 ATP synthase F1 subunit epsilon [Bacteroidales bacterium]HNV49490.1 ATP synthase F1 subunit epsilon [Bacteroidales bacterium]
MTIRVISKTKTIYSETVKIAQFPGVDGLFGIMQNHAPMVYVLKKGNIKVKEMNDTEKIIEIEGGLLEVFNNEIIVLAD